MFTFTTTRQLRQIRDGVTMARDFEKHNISDKEALHFASRFCYSRLQYRAFARARKVKTAF